MTNLITAIRGAACEQARVTALENCFQTWDGNIDEEVIIQGIHDRLIAIDWAEKGLRINRACLTRVEVLNTAGSRVLDFCKTAYWPRYPNPNTKTFVHNGCFITASGLHLEHFHDAELQIAGKWLMDNFHH